MGDNIRAMVENVLQERNAKTGDYQSFSPVREGVKPTVLRVKLPNGSIRFIGITEAARWLGCTQQALGQIARGKEFYRGPLYHRARAEFPELFVSGND